MKPFPFFIILYFTFLSSYSQDIKIERDVIYGKSLNWQNMPEELKLDLYFSGQDKNVPLILFLHGGRFYRGSKDEHSSFCSRLAKQGFAVANVNYRTGFDTSMAQKDLGIIMAAYRAVQDAAAALRFLSHNEQKYHIDKSAIFIGGESAGAVTTLANAYVTQAEWDGLFPFLHQKLGPVQGSGNDLTNGFSIKGVVSLWGGIVDTVLISASESKAIPVLLIHSQADEVIPFEHGKGQKTAHGNIFGSYDIAQRFKTNGSCASLFYSKTAKHFYGFSHQYVVNAINIFIDYVLSGTCQSFMVENKKEDVDKPFSGYLE